MAPITKEPTLEQWEELYQVALRIKELEPWIYLWDSDLITILLPGREEPILCSVMGRNGECFGVGVYPGYEAMQGLHKILTNQEEEEAMWMVTEQNFLALYLGDREELETKDREIIKSLNLKFRGRNEWIYFRSFEPGYYPWQLSASQAVLLTDVLKNLVMAVRAIIEKGMKVDFENGQTLLRYYSEKDKLWINAASPELPFPTLRRRLIMDDEVLAAQIKRRPKNTAQLELDASFVFMPTRDVKGERPYFPKLVLLAERRDGLILDQKVLRPDEDYGNAILNSLINYIHMHNRPSILFVRDDRLLGVVEDFCKKTGIKCVIAKSMTAIDGYLESMSEDLEV